MPEITLSPPADVDFSDVTEPFWAGLRRGELSLQRCAHGHGFRQPPTLYCPECLSTDSEWVKLSGRGHLYTYTLVPLSREPDGPVYVAALVCPEEAPDTKIFANLIDCTPQDLAIDLPLQLATAPEGRDLAVFRPLQEAK